MKEIPFNTLLGKSLSNIITKTDCFGDDVLIFQIIKPGHIIEYHMRHDQDCCENVFLDEIVGELIDLIHSPILLAEKRISDNQNLQALAKPTHHQDYIDVSQTWTFYELATIKGSVTLKWFGSSNGYYSESVNFYEDLRIL